MTPADYDFLSELAPAVKTLGRIGVCSPLRDGELRLFPEADRLTRRRWDLNRATHRRFDAVVASNVFMYSPDPERWFRNVLASCRWFVLLDLVRRKRSDASEYGSDGDCMRYSVGSERSRADRSFDLASLGDRLLAWRTFDGGANEYDPSPVHVAAVIRGDLGEPILRVDDYPTGVRPILDDLAPLHDILGLIDGAGLPFVLGIVPALLKDDMARELRGLRHLVPAAHGYDHCYPRYHRRLIEAGDPYNQNTVGVFNEFRGVRYADILRRLTDGRERLSDRLHSDVTRYIPPCNRGDRKTGRALPECGFDRYLSEKRIPGCELPWLRSDFYGRSTEYDPAASPDVTTLHLTWEADLVRAGSGHRIDRVLDDLLERRAILKNRVRPLCQQVGLREADPREAATGYSSVV